MVSLMQQLSLPIDQASMDEIMAYYTANSPLYLDQIPDDFADPLLRFEKRSIGFLSTEERPQITGVHFIDLDGD